MTLREDAWGINPENRLDARFAQLARRRRAVLIPYVTAASPAARPVDPRPWKRWGTLGNGDARDPSFALLARIVESAF